ncbi:hypothetical protein [Burkholderia cepacia]|uniref:hypothetical protein n=1 Tax=Burkholderia cepacia TaxID=292 RepID=UPI000A61A086|nr:hypothetical protein [Burkholderia cepacia]
MLKRSARRKFSIDHDGGLVISHPGYSDARQLARERARQLEALIAVGFAAMSGEASRMPESLIPDLLYLASDLASEVVDALDGKSADDGRRSHA